MKSIINLAKLSTFFRVIMPKNTFLLAFLLFEVQMEFYISPHVLIDLSKMV